MTDKVRIVQKYGMKTPKSKSTIFATRPRSMRASTRSLKRSAYAFSHEEGFAALIKEGKMMPEQNVSFDFYLHIIRINHHILSRLVY